MGLIINHNMPAVFTAYQLDAHYARLAVNTERLSSGLRINGPEDDPAGYGIRELMRSELGLMEQSLRNSADGVSLLQTAEGALSVIDEKLLRMRELAAQAATGTYTTLQRDIINSEYQAMAAEIDRIAASTSFNGVKLLDGSLNSKHHGQGLKIHFGAGNSAAEDYYFVKIGDVRATTFTGLRIGGDAKNDIWSTTSLSGEAGAKGCCGGGVPSLTQPVSAWASGSIFSYGYNWDEAELDDAGLSKGRYVAGAYRVGASTSLERLINSVNKGTQSRVRADFKIGVDASALVAGDEAANANRICLDDEIYYFGSATLARTECGEDYKFVDLARYYSGAAVADDAGRVYAGSTPVSAFVAAVNTESSKFWAKAETFSYRSGYVSVYVFNREGGNHDDLKASDERLGEGVSGDASLQEAITWHDDESGFSGSDGSYFGNGGEFWGTMRAAPTGYGTWGVSLHGRDAGSERDLWILNTGAEAGRSGLDINFYGQSIGPNGFGLAGTTSGLNRESFFEVQNASDGDWAGASIRTQSTAQLALEAINEAISRKEGIRARLGALMNRLENTMANTEAMMESLQAAESRISDVDVATEMTDFVRNQVLSQAAVSILSQANAMPEMALSLLNGLGGRAPPPATMPGDLPRQGESVMLKIRELDEMNELTGLLAKTLAMPACHRMPTEVSVALRAAKRQMEGLPEIIGDLNAAFGRYLTLSKALGRMTVLAEESASVPEGPEAGRLRRAKNEEFVGLARVVAREAGHPCFQGPSLNVADLAGARSAAQVLGYLKPVLEDLGHELRGQKSLIVEAIAETMNFMGVVARSYPDAEGAAAIRDTLGRVRLPKVPDAPIGYATTLH